VTEGQSAVMRQSGSGVLRDQGWITPKQDARIGVDASAGVQVEVRGRARAPRGDRDAQSACGSGPLSCSHIFEACGFSNTVVSKGILVRALTAKPAPSSYCVRQLLRAAKENLVPAARRVHQTCILGTVIARYAGSWL